jgi:hypothetical protein
VDRRRALLYTLTLVDVATGWVSCAGLRDKRAETVLAAICRLQHDLPFELLGLDWACWVKIVKLCRLLRHTGDGGLPPECRVAQSSSQIRAGDHGDRELPWV